MSDETIKRFFACENQLQTWIQGPLRLRQLMKIMNSSKEEALEVHYKYGLFYDDTLDDLTKKAKNYLVHKKYYKFAKDNYKMSDAAFERLTDLFNLDNIDDPEEILRKRIDFVVNEFK